MPAIAVSAQLLTWARQLSTAVSNTDTGRDSDAPRANGGSARHQEGQSAGPTEPSGTATTGVSSAALADPFAFDMGSFGGPAGSGDGPAAPAVSAAGHDPFAFDMGAFGGAGTLTGSHEAQAADQGSRGESSSSGATADPYAFNAGAFGMPEGGFANDSSLVDDRPGSNGGSSSQQEQRAAGSASADPFAFSMDAFGGVSGSHPQEDQGEDSSDPYAADRGDAAGVSSAQQAGGNTAGDRASDPFSFDLSSFGVGTAYDPQPPLNVAGTSGSKQFALQEIAAYVSSQRAASGSAAAGDPFAFDMGAFGMGGDSASQLTADVAGNDPFASDRAAAELPQSPSARGTSDILSGTLDPASFGMGTTESAVSALKPPPAVSAERESKIKGAAPDQASEGTPSDRAMRSSQLAALTSYSGSMAAGARTGNARQQPRQVQHTGGMHARFEAPTQEPFEPLSAVELQDLQELLSVAAGLQSPSSEEGASKTPSAPFVMVMHIFADDRTPSGSV